MTASLGLDPDRSVLDLDLVYSSLSEAPADGPRVEAPGLRWQTGGMTTGERHRASRGFASVRSGVKPGSDATPSQGAPVSVKGDDDRRDRTHSHGQQYMTMPAGVASPLRQPEGGSGIAPGPTPPQIARYSSSLHVFLHRVSSAAGIEGSAQVMPSSLGHPTVPPESLQVR